MNLVNTLGAIDTANSRTLGRQSRWSPCGQSLQGNHIYGRFVSLPGYLFACPHAAAWPIQDSTLKYQANEINGERRRLKRRKIQRPHFSIFFHQPRGRRK
jgi:hypothetical protein